MTEELKRIVNSSGFAFQLGVEQAIRSAEADHGWRVVTREHPWAFGNAEGFVDVVISKGRAIGIVECKRTRDADWVFLVPTNESRQPIGSRTLWVAGDGREAISGWDHVMHHPDSYIASFCTIRGSGENDRPLLERLGATLLTSTDGLAHEEVSILRRRERPFHGFYLPIIVTNAKLHVCVFDPAEVNLTEGTIDQTKFESVPFVRFQKAFSVSAPPGFAPTNLRNAAQARERTLWIVQADNLVNFLKRNATDGYSEPQPWEEPMRALMARNKEKAS